MRRAGFTLLEAAVSLAIVGTVAVAALDAFAVEARTARRARAAAPAVALAGERLARLQLLDARELRALPDSMREGAFATADGWSYRWRASVQPVRGDGDLYTVSVTVTWDTGEYPLWARVYRPAGPDQ